MEPLAGKILIADNQGDYVLKLEGDVRLTICTAVDEQVALISSDQQLRSVVVDVCDAQGIDSTTLGLLAKLALATQKQQSIRVVVYSDNVSITRLLKSMCLQHIVDLKEEPMPAPVSASCVTVEEDDEQLVKDTVIEAHQALMEVSPQNELRFRDLMESLGAG